MRNLLWALALLLAAGWVHAGEAEYQRGDYRFSVGPEPGFVVRRTVPGQWDGEAPGKADARWRYWLYDVQADRRGDSDARYVEHVYEPTSTSMLGEAGRFQVSFNPEYQQLRIHRVELRRDGAWQDRLFPDKISLARRESDFEQDLSNGEVTALIVLDDVRVDDVVRISYTIHGSNPILQGQLSDWGRMGWGSPVLDTYLRVLEDPGTRLATHVENGAPPAVISHGPAATEANVHVHAAAPVVDEGSHPVWYQPYPLVQVAVDQGWDDVVDWALPLYPAVTALPAELEARIEQWHQLEDSHERVRAALRAVQDEVRYFGAELGENTHRPNPPALTWSRRYGDCKDKVYLLVTLLERLGVEAVPALVSTERGRALLDFVPSASVFNHVVVRARVGESVMWLDPTISQQGGDPRDSDLSAYGVALPVEEGSRALESIEPPEFDSGIKVVEHFAPAGEDGAMVLDIRTIYSGRSADRARRNLSNERPSELARRYSNYYGRIFGDLSVVEEPRIDDDRQRNIVTVTERYRLTAPFESEGAIQKAIDVHAQALDGPTTLPAAMTRDDPVAFSQPARYEHRISLDIPKGWTPVFNEDSVAYASPAFAYKRDIGLEDGGVTLEYTLDVKQPDVTPEHVALHLRELREVRDSLSARLRFKVPSGLEAEERSARLKALLRDVMENGGAE